MTTEKAIKPVLRIRFHVEAWDASGYGDDRSRDFDSKIDAVSYARDLPAAYCPSVSKRITMDPITVPVEWKEPADAG